MGSTPATSEILSRTSGEFQALELVQGLAKFSETGKDEDLHSTYTGPMHQIMFLLKVEAY